MFVVLLIFTLSIGTAVHNHGILGSDGGAEKISQSKFMCPACVFDGKPVALESATIVVCASGHPAFITPVESSFERILGKTSSSRAPPLP